MSCTTPLNGVNNRLDLTGSVATGLRASVAHPVYDASVACAVPPGGLTSASVLATVRRGSLFQLPLHGIELWPFLFPSLSSVLPVGLLFSGHPSGAV